MMELLLFRIVLIFLLFDICVADSNVTLKSLIGDDDDDFDSPDCISSNIRVSSTILPVYSSATAPYSNSVSVTALSSALVDGFGDVYAIALITVLNNGVEWESETHAGSIAALPELPESDWPQDILQVQYDNRYGLFYLQPGMEKSFPAEIAVLSPTDKIRFKVNDKSFLGTCIDNYIEFTFFKPSTILKNYLRNSETNLRNTTLSLQGMTEWPFGDLIFKLCPYNAVAVSLGISSDMFGTSVASTENLTIKVITTPATSSAEASSAAVSVDSKTEAVPSTAQSSTPLTKTSATLLSHSSVASSAGDSVSASDPSMPSATSSTPLTSVPTTSSTDLPTSASSSTHPSTSSSTQTSTSLSTADGGSSTPLVDGFGGYPVKMENTLTTSPLDSPTSSSFSSTALLSSSTAPIPSGSSSISSTLGDLPSSSTTLSSTTDDPSTSTTTALPMQASNVVSATSAPVIVAASLDLMPSTTASLTSSSTTSTTELSKTSSTPSLTLPNMPPSAVLLSLSSTTLATNPPTTSATNPSTTSINEPTSTSSAPVSTTHVDPEVITVYPTLFDIDSNPNRNLTIITKRSLNNLSCLLVNSQTRTTIGAATTHYGVNTTVVFSAAFADEVSYFLNCETMGETILSNCSLFFASFRKLVEIDAYALLGNGDSVQIDFKRELDTDPSNPAVCVSGSSTGLHSEPISSSNKSVVCPMLSGHAIYVIRKRELTEATFKYQGEVSITTDVTSTTAPLTLPTTTKTDFNSVAASSTTAPLTLPTTKSNSNGITATFLPTLDGIEINLTSDSGFSLRAFNCSQIFVSAAAFGLGPTCTIDKSKITVRFGSAPVLALSQNIVMRTAALTEQYIDNPSGSSTKYDTFTAPVPSNAETPNVVIIQPTDVLKCDLALSYSSEILGGSGGRDLNYTWFVVDSVSKNLYAMSNQSTFTLRLESLGGSIAEITLQSCNFVGKCANSTSVTADATNISNEFAVEIVGVPQNPIPSQAITLYAEAQMVTCNGVQYVLDSNNLFFAWSVNDTIVSRDSVVTFRAKTFTAGAVVVVKLTVSYIKLEIVYNTSAIAFLTFGSMPLIPVVDSTNRVVSAISDLNIDASRSFDPNSGSTNLNHAWTGDTITEPMNTSKLYMAASNLTPGKQYKFLDTITSPNSPLTTSISVNVHVMEGSVPTIQLRPVSDYEISTEEYFRIQAYIQSEYSSLTTQWYLFRGSDNSSIDLKTYFANAVRSFDNEDPGGIVALSITIPPASSNNFNGWPGLQPGDYVLRLVATDANGSAFADYRFTVVALPGEPIITISPESDIVALETSVRFDTNATADNTLLFRFGLRTIFIDNSTSDQWYHQTAMDYFKTVLASALPGSNASCGIRVGYQGLLEVCDRAGACSTASTDNIIVDHPINTTAAIENILQLAISDIATGNIERAVIKLEAIKAEQCSNTLNSTVVESLISKVNDQLANGTDVNELLDGVMACVKVMNSASPSYVNKVFDLVVRSQDLVLATDKSKRRKRATAATSLAALAAATISTVPEDAADKLLFAYDGLIGQNQNIASVYLNNIVNLLGGFCVQVDSTRTMSSEGDGYTIIQAEGILPEEASFLTTTFSIAGSSNGVSLSKAFQSAYLSYKCGTNQATICTEVCLASAFISNSAIHDNTYLSLYFFESSYTIPQFSNIASDLYYVMFGDPVSGNALTLGAGVTYNLTIPLTSYAPSNYYACFIYINSIWDNSPCRSNDYARSSGGENIMDCQCAVGGIVAVYTVNPPAAPYYLPYNEYMLIFNLSSVAECKFSQLSTFIGKLANASHVDLKRFVNYTCAAGTNLNTDPATVSVILRPPFLETQVSNSVAMQAINRAVSVGAAATFATNITVTAFTANLITRDLKGDGYARRMPLRFVKALKDIGNDTSTLLPKWLASMPRNMRIDPYRFKNPTIQYNMLFNFTITLPFQGESLAAGSTALSAEELSMWIMEQTMYGELDLRDLQEAQIAIDPVGYTDIVQLVPISPTNTLMTVLGVVVACGIVLISMITGGLVFLKLRTDRLIEEHNRNMRMVNVPVGSHRPMAAQHPLPTVIPFESNGMVLGPTGIVDPGIDKAADTVFFGQPNELRMR